MKLAKALQICGKITDMPNAGLGMVAAELAKRRGIRMENAEQMKNLVLDVASRHNVVVLPVKNKRAKPKQKKRKAGPTNDRFYLCREWRALRYLVLKNTDGRCMCCGAGKDDGVRIHVDHIKPRSQFPKLELDINNLQVLCEDCNIGKGAWDQTDWRAKF